MAIFRKKPVTVEANQFQDLATPYPGVLVDEDGCAYVVTVHLQKCYVEPGDWIIAEPDGVHFYPCKPVVFSNTYELVRD